MRLKYIILLCAFYQCVVGSIPTEKIEIFTAEYINENGEAQTARKQQGNIENPIRSISDLVLQQTEAIKKIVSEQVPTKHNLDSNIIKPTTYDNEDVKSKQEIENESIEELKKKCQHLSRIFNSAAPMQPQDVSTEKPRTVEAFGPYMQPNLLKYKPKFPSPPALNMPQPPVPQMSGNYFIFTQNPEMYGPRINKYSDKMDTAASSIEEDIVDPPTEEEADYEDEQESVTNTTQSLEPEREPEPEPETEKPTTISIPKIPSSTIAPSTTIKPKFKYVRLEPIVLKKVLLPAGKSSLYWYRLLPTTQSFVQIPDTPDTENVNAVAQPQNYNNEVSLPAQYQFYVDPQSGVIKSNTITKPSVVTTTSTTTTTEKPSTIPAVEPQSQPQPQHQPQFFINPQTGMIYQSALPHQFIYHKRIPDLTPPPTPPTTTTTTTTTTEKIPLPAYTIDIPQPPEEKPAESTSKKQYKHEFRFVIPMVVTGTQDEVSNYPYQIDPYAYLPKGQRPETMNIPMPYVPNYQMIHKLTIPSKLQELARKQA